jgi:hypothetical protein
MEIRSLLAELASRRIREYLFELPVLGLAPRLYPPATAEQISALGVYAGQELEQQYRDFLGLMDGMDGFFPDMRILGCRDRGQGVSEVTSLQFLEILRESGPPVDVGLPENVDLFPVAIDGDAARAIFMLRIPRVLPERFWWVGEGDSMFFGTFADVLGYVLDADSYFPREAVE